MSEIDEIFNEIRRRTDYRHKYKYYQPLLQDDSEKIRSWYRSRINIPLDGDEHLAFKNIKGNVVAIGYDRVVIGDYGPYIEFDERHMALEFIKPKWPGKPKRKVKYIWMETQDNAKTKVYHQQGTVKYADYKIGKYYIDPLLLKTEIGGKVLKNIYDIWSKK